ncbi:MAG: hypothetical protein R3E68_21610 [Burkholderiaceae bacterium]
MSAAVAHPQYDHITDLNDVITSRWIMPPEPSPLTIIGPPGTRDVVEHIVASLSCDIHYRMTTMPTDRALQLEVIEVTRRDH